MNSTTRFPRLAATVAVAALCATPLAATAQESMPGEGKTIDMARATWDTGWWPAEVYKQLFERLGYDVSEVTTLDNPPFYQAVSQGDVDLWVNGWFPLHNTYEDTFSQGAEKVGYVAKGGALQGYLIDRKTAEEHDITYVDDLTKDDIQKLFDSNGDGKADMVACPPGWGCEEMIAYHFEAYDWDDDFNAIKAGYSASMADAVGRYRNGEPIFFYTWTPNWTVGELKPGEDVVWLQVKETKLPEEQADLADATTVENLEGCQGEQPCNLGWPANDIRPVVNSEFLEENPAVRSLLESVQIPIEDIFTQNAQMNAGEDSPEDLQQQAEAWLQEHQSEVDGWLSAARAAAE
jgi:glycine betaine/proline transport system substrate-binding protein